MTQSIKPTRSHPILWLMGVLILFGIAVVVWQIVARQRAQESVRAKNEPLTISELELWYPAVPDERNAALIALRAMDSYKDVGDNSLVPFATSVQPGPVGAPLTPETRHAISVYLVENVKSLDLIAQIYKMPESRYPVPFSSVLTINLQHLSGLRDLARLQAVETIYKADCGSSAGACEGISRVLHLAGTIKNEPLLISQSSRIFVQWIAIDAAEYTVNRSSVGLDELKILQNAFASAEDPDLLYKALVGERCIAMRPGGVIRGNRSTGRLMSDTLRSLLQSGLANAMNDAVEASRLPCIERAMRFRKLNDPVTLRLNPLASFHLQPFENAAVSHDRINTRIRVAASAILVERYRLENGKLPDSLEHLVPNYLDKLPVDPFDGKPLRYLRKDAGFVVYGVGQNLTDDGGVESSERGEGDLVFEVTH